MFSITGEHDHSPFGGQGVQLVWGERPDKSHVHIAQVQSGLGCDCVCPACGVRLVAHKGRKVAHNFHHYNAQACAGARETNAHVWAKKILEDCKMVWLPAGVAVAGAERKNAFAAQLYEFDFARLEKRQGSIVPDVVLTKGSRELIVEILVTHACDEVKVDKIREQGMSALEIDLSKFKNAESEEIVATALIGTDAMHRAPRHWIFNTKVDQASERFAVELAEREAKRRAELARVAAQREAALASQVQGIIRAAASLKVVSTEATIADMGVVNSYGLGEYIDLPIEGRGFRVSPTLWQSAILARVVIPRMNYSSSALTITARMAASAIYQDCLSRDVSSFPDAELKAAVRAADGDFVFAGDAIERYLDQLEELGILRGEFFHTGKASGQIGWELSREAGAKLRARHAELLERDRRDAKAKRTLRAILDGVQAGERAGFALERWLERAIPGIDARFADLIETGGESWRVLDQALEGISRMQRGGPPVQRTLGLPIGAEITRAVERERVKQAEATRGHLEAEAKAARHRRNWLNDEARRLLGHQKASAWLAEQSEGATRLAAASASDSALSKAERELASAHREHLEQERRDREADECRRQLGEAVAKVYDSDRATVFMRSTQPRLGMSPWDRCTSKSGLDECLAVLHGKPAQRVSRKGWR